MTKIPLPPKRSYKNRVVSQQTPEISSRPISGPGFHVAKSLKDTAIDFDVMGSRPPRNMAPKIIQQVKPRPNGNNNSPSQHEPEFIPTLHEILDEAPDVIIGEEVEIKGDFQFDGLLHLYGRFEGRLLSDGDVYLGPKAVLKSNVHCINRLIIDGGHVIGRISVQQLGIAGAAFVKGDIFCKYIEVNSDNCTILGKLYVHPKAPEVVEFPRERWTPKEEIVISQLSSMKPFAPLLSPVKETLEVSIQVTDPDEILTPAELALRAKLETKERRKEAKRHQQEEALRLSHGLAPLSPKNKKEFSSSPAQKNSKSNTKSISSIQSPQVVDPGPADEALRKENDEGKESIDLPIKLVLEEIDEDKNDHDISVSKDPQILSALDLWSTPSAAEEVSTLDDIHSLQKTAVSAVSTEAIAAISEDDDQQKVSDSSIVPKKEGDESSLEQVYSPHSSLEKVKSFSNHSSMKEVTHESDTTRPGLMLPSNSQQRAESLAQEQQDGNPGTEEIASNVTGAENFATPTSEPEKDPLTSQSPEKEQNTEGRKGENKNIPVTVAEE